MLMMGEDNERLTNASIISFFGAVEFEFLIALI